jgi:hypothetical protein
MAKPMPTRRLTPVTTATRPVIGPLSGVSTSGSLWTAPAAWMPDRQVVGDR